MKRIARFQTGETTLYGFMERIIESLKKLGRERTAETYASTLRSFMQFRENRDITFEEITSETTMLYEAYLKKRGVTPNTSSFYMRILRATYNRAVEEELTVQRFPFKHVYTGIDKTVKRALQLRTIKRIKAMDLAADPVLDFTRDIFMFSFYTRGMSFVDIANLKKSDLRNGVLSYRRRKTGQQLFIKWEKCMQDIIDKYDSSSVYLLPVINSRKHTDERMQYMNAAQRINKNLKRIGKELGISVPLTMYVARHSWASIAKSRNIPLSIISEGMGHNSEATTRIYLASLDNMAIDRANNMILKLL